MSKATFLPNYRSSHKTTVLWDVAARQYAGNFYILSTVVYST